MNQVNTSATFISKLTSIVGASSALAGDAALLFHTDERNRYHNAPLAVVLPNSVEQVSHIVQLCANQSPPVSIIPQGGNTGLVGGCAVLAERESILLNLTKLNKIIAIDGHNRTMTLQAGVTLEMAQHSASKEKLLFPLSLASQNAATIGGNLATNAGGTQVLRYGNMRDLCLGLEVVLPNGEIWQGLNTLRKNNTGYDLKHLFIGAEGTLGIITAATLKLFPAPTDSQVALIATTDIEKIIDSFDRLQRQFDAQLTAFEYISPNALDLVCQQFNFSHPFGNRIAHVALVEVSTSTPNTPLQTMLEQGMVDLLDKHIITNAVVAQHSQQAQTFWLMREYISATQKKIGKNIKHDISVPISAIAEFVNAASKALQEQFAGIQPIVFGHIGDGNLHFNVSAGSAFANADALMAQEIDINRIVYDCVAQYQGSISAEHGIGLLKRDFMPTIKSPIELNMMRQLKKTLDPQNIMNPNKIFSL